MPVSLSDKDLTILNRVLLYTAIPIERRQSLLAEASDEAREIGQALLTNTELDKFASAHAALKQWRDNRSARRLVPVGRRS